MSLKTHDVKIVRGQTWRMTFTVKDERGARVDLTGATVYLQVRADIKAAPAIQKTSPAGGIAISTQSGSTLGQCVATVVPADTADLAAGDYVWDAWVVEADGDRFPIVAPSRLSILAEVTTIP